MRYDPPFPIVDLCGSRNLMSSVENVELGNVPSVSPSVSKK